MSLPKISAPEWNITIPSSGKTARFRPFLTKEYKTLLHAVEMQDPGVFINSIVNIIESCTNGELKVDELTMFDVDYIFLNIRAKSVGEIVPIRYVCNREIEKKITDKSDEGELIEKTIFEPCGTKINVDLNLQDVRVVIPTKYVDRKVIRINETTGIKLKAPSFRHFRELINQGSKNLQNANFNISEFENDLIFNCVESIYEGDKIHLPKKDFNLEEFDTFLEHLPAAAINFINDFFEELPYVAVQTEIRCPVCGNVQTVEVRTLEDFFV